MKSLLIHKDWELDIYRKVFRRKKDGLEIDQEWAWKVINLDSDSLEDELEKLAKIGGYDE
mgnify:CR=1 FL=1